MSEILSTKHYMLLQTMDVVFGGSLATVLSLNGCANWIVCPECGIDDFTHAESCSHIME